jgi:hypothetical protein
MKPASGAVRALFWWVLLWSTLSLPASAQMVLVPSGAVWKYLDDGSNQGTVWRDPAFPDDAWAAGPAQLGYGDGDEATVVSYGPDPSHKYITTYFRHHLELPDPPACASLVLEVLRDDGAVVYLNGAEIWRTNMPPGDINYLTLAPVAVGDEDEQKFYRTYLEPGLLLPGANTIAVELHQADPASSDLSFDFELETSPLPLPVLRKEPYLIFEGDPTRMRVGWQRYVTGGCEIAWGIDTLCTLGQATTFEYGADHQHAFRITDLVPGTRYHYRVTAGDQECRGSFRAAPASAGTAIKFLVCGDTRSYPAAHDSVAAAMLAVCAADSAYQSLILSAGDLVHDGEQEEDWDNEFFGREFRGIRALVAGLPYQACMGNHEGSGELFAKYFPYPFVGGRYWSFDYGPAHFVIVDQFTDYDLGSAQLAWIADDLAATAQPWKFICLHEPGWSAGYHENNTLVQLRIQPLCLAYDVSAVLAGHNHYYARAVVEGVQHITTGGGGAPLRDPDPSNPYIVATARSHHFCKLTIDGAVLTFEAVSPAGDVLDAFTMEKPSMAAGDAGPPARLILVSPNPFMGETTIRFTAGDGRPPQVSIWDLTGRVVRSLRLEGRGDRAVRWDGRDAAGRPLGSGVYLCAPAGDGPSGARRLLLLR